VKLYQAKHVAQKAKKEAKRRRVAEEKEKKKRILEYLQQLWNEVLEKEAIFLEITESKHKEVVSRDEKGKQPSKKAKGK